MGNKEGYLEFIFSENYKNQLDVWYRAYNISREKIELFQDFLISLYELVDETYLGPDVFESTENQRGHFSWCWDKVIENFSKEKMKMIKNFYQKDIKMTMGVGCGVRKNF